MSKYNTTVEKYQGVLPKNKSYKFIQHIKQNNVIDSTYMTHEPKCHIRRLTKKTYVHTKTGEVREVMPKVEGKQFRNIRSLKIIFKNLRQLITTNFEGEECEKFLTLTYREQHSDPKKIYNDIDLFNKRLKWHHPNIGYIHIVEPHESGNFHIHSLIKRTDGEELYINYDKMRDMWGHGAIRVEELKNVDHIGAYFIAYFSNMEISEKDLHKYPDDIKEKNGKKYIKGKRLDFYPDYMKIYRNSRNLKKPESTTEIDETYNMTYSDMFKITMTDSDGNTGDTYIKNEQRKRKKNI